MKMAARRRNVVGEVMEEESQRRKLETGLAKGEGGGGLEVRSQALGFESKSCGIVLTKI